MKIEPQLAWIADGYRSKLFEDENLKQATVKPSDKDNFILHPQDDKKLFVQSKIARDNGNAKTSGATVRVSSASHRRIKSASSVRLQDRPWRQSPPSYPAGFMPRRRPNSALTHTRPMSAMSGTSIQTRRVKSAGSIRTQSEARAQEILDEMRTGFYLVNRLYENEYSCGNIRLHPASPAPDFRYFDRHSRCYNHTHAHHPTNEERPQKACDKFLEACGSHAVSPARPDDPYAQPQRYIDYHRPRTAPGTRKELQYIPRPTYVYRGHTPHFCNFVHQAHLHSKHLRDTTDSTGIPDSEIEDDIDYIESFEGRIVGKYRKGSNASLNSSASGSVNGLVPLPNLDDYATEPVKDSIPEMKEDLAVSGTEGRPASPSSLDGDGQNGDGGLPITGVEVKVSTPIKSGPSVKHMVLSEDKKIDYEDINLQKKKRKGYIRFRIYDDGSGDKLVIHEEDGNELEPSKVSSDRKKSIDKSSQNQGADKNSSNNNTRVPSPSEPPPSPEAAPIKLPINKPRPPDTPQPKERKRSCVNKKTKKSFERTRRMKEPEEIPLVVDTPKLDEPEPTSIETESEKPESKLDLKVPELPSSADTEKKQRKEKSKPKRHLIETGDDQPKDLDPIELLNEQNRQIRSEIDWSTMDTNGLEDTNKRQPQIKSWIQGRLALSQQSSRFELPMDMKRLESMTPQEYVRKYCIITSRRNNLYQKIFLKNKDKTHTILFKDLDKTLKEVLVNTITSEQIQEILKLLEVDDQTKVDFRLFAGMAAYAERVLYPKYVSEEYLKQLIELELISDLLGTEDTVDMPEYQKEKIESADFSALDWKFHGVNVNPHIKTLLKQIS